MANKPSRSAPQTPAKESSQNGIFIFSRSVDLAHHLVKWGAIVWIATFVRDAFIAAIGQSTSVNVLVALIFSKDNDYGAPWILAAIVTIWGCLERALRRNKTQRFQDRIVELELLIDPSRTSSGIAKSGRTHPRDKR